MRRSVLCAPSCAALSAALPVASAAAPRPGEASRFPFTARHRAASDDYPAAETRRSKSVRLSDSVNSPSDVMNSGITEFGTGGTVRSPDRTNTPGYDSDVFDPRGALRDGADRVHVRNGSRKDTVRLGVLFFQADVRL
ncbi:hypothetical protein ACGFZH_07525 [Streptomyces zaomyceticus]|uniref:hypothetical protein n=1 Tax=Streptomyces zaomyceticus TaxID=68286 RepID=UPI00371FC527